MCKGIQPVLNQRKKNHFFLAILKRIKEGFAAFD